MDQEVSPGHVDMLFIMTTRTRMRTGRYANIRFREIMMAVSSVCHLSHTRQCLFVPCNECAFLEYVALVRGPV